MFLEVYTEEEKQMLLNKGYKLIKEVPMSSATKYLFINSKDLSFDNLKVRVKVTNTLTF